MTCKTPKASYKYIYTRSRRRSQLFWRNLARFYQFVSRQVLAGIPADLEMGVVLFGWQDHTQGISVYLGGVRNFMQLAPLLELGSDHTQGMLCGQSTCARRQIETDVHFNRVFWVAVRPLPFFANGVVRHFWLFCGPW